MSTHDWTPAEIVEFCARTPRTDVPTAGAMVLGVGAAAAYKHVERGDFPLPVISVGRRMVVPTAPILRLLGLSPDMDVAGPAPPEPATAAK